ncbi:regulator of G-protein signaling 5-like [Spinachia spinachia]
MKENIACVSIQNMALTGCTTPDEASTGRKGLKRNNWRNRIAFLLKTNTSKTILHLKKRKSYRPTADEVQQWAQSLDKLLCHKYGKTVFFVFLKSEFCEENIEFWTACEDLRNITSQKALASKANSIYEEFIRNEAPKEVNLDYHTRNTIVQNLQEPSVTSFQAAQMKVYSLMENDSYPRFINSDLYRETCAASRGAGRRVASSSN